MGKFKPPGSIPDPNENFLGSRAGPQTRRIAAYRKMLSSQATDAPETMPETLARTVSPEPEQDSKYRRVAQFLILIGGDEAAQILSHLAPEQVEVISKEIASIRGITAEEAESVLGEFRSLLAASYNYSGSSTGGVDTARRLLYAAFGSEKGEALLRKTVPGATNNVFGFLEDFSGEQLAMLLKDERPATVALVLSRLPPQLAAEVLSVTAADQKFEIVKRIARLGKTSPEVLERVADALREKARHVAHTETTSIDGMSALTAILKSSDASFGDRILNKLVGQDPDLGRDLKERLHTLDDVVKADDRPIQEKLMAMSDRDIVLLLKGRSDAFTEKIMANISAQRRVLIREEADVLGPVRRRDVDVVAGEFLTWFRENREAGHILLVDDEDIIE
ncbi:MAG: flagellar motor switch protein FliG [Treponema sp.]|nr:flagellar motor switch protein FliG [Treponema sp.]